VGGGSSPLRRIFESPAFAGLSAFGLSSFQSAARRCARSAADRAPLAGETAALSELGTFDADLTSAVAYTECARIWNPIHTDPRVARSSGLHGAILHGTATLARCVSILARTMFDGDVGQIRSLSFRFSDPVALPSTVAVQAAVAGDGRLHFRATSGASTVLGKGIAEMI
jgi:acyl dehydratase